MTFVFPSDICTHWKCVDCQRPWHISRGNSRSRRSEIVKQTNIQIHLIIRLQLRSSSVAWTSLYWNRDNSEVTDLVWCHIGICDSPWDIKKNATRELINFPGQNHIYRMSSNRNTRLSTVVRAASRPVALNSEEELFTAMGCFSASHFYDNFCCCEATKRSTVKCKKLLRVHRCLWRLRHPTTLAYPDGFSALSASEAS